MNFSEFGDICKAIKVKFGNDIIVELFPEAVQPYIVVDKDALLQICEFLYKDPQFYFDLLNCITAHDNGPEIGTMEVWYHLTSIPKEQSFIIKLSIDRNPEDGETLSKVPSVASIWKTADWHERESFDLLGIHFENHPDLRRILLPADWEGYPLRKDYVEQEKYHGIKVKY
jgi:NADH-quinone oxidoreductase subunit C